MEKSVLSGLAVPASQRITRSRAAALHASGSLLPLEPPPIPPRKRLTRGSSKRAASDENSSANLGATFQQKKREVLKDISGIFCKNSDNCVEASIQQTKPSHCAKIDLHKGNSRCDVKDSKLMLNASVESSLVEDEEHNKMVEDVDEALIALESQESTVSVEPEKTLLLPPILESVTYVKSMHATASLEDHSISEKLLDKSKNVKDNLSQDYIDIDAVHADPQFCSLYAPDVYTNLRAAELIRRPLPDFMETVQRDITPSMRAILIDWLVEVAQEHRLVPDTLYLTVNFVDRFLSENFIERQRLQLLGITCMLIASKFEEMCAPRVKELCWLTDNTYSGQEVLKLESQVLKYLNFQLSVPSTKTFLRRFHQASQASFKVPTLPLGYLTLYLAELTLLEYNFLKFLPSMIAASAVFLARWTLDQSCHPWDPTLQHYSSYKASDLKEVVVALHDLQINCGSSTPNAIWEKYNQQQFKFVAALAPPKLIPSLFC